MKQIVLVIILIFFCTSMSYGEEHSNPAIGLWYTHKTSKGEVNVVEIFEENGKLYGYGLSNKDPRKNTTIYDTRNPRPELRSQQLTGLVIIYDIVPTNTMQSCKGFIYDPENGKTYYLQISVKDPNILILKPTVDALGIVGPRLLWRRVPSPHIYTPLPREELKKPY